MTRILIIYIMLLLAAVLTACAGAAGSQGKVGPQGDTGPAGNGATPTITTNPATALQCPSGGTVLTVSYTYQSGWGDNNYQQTPTVVCNGATGAVGLPGLPGTNATPITVVQFCPGTPTYPSTFVEQGLCIDGNLYGVYSANDGFWSLLPPGAYTSDGIGSSCNFTIQPNCVIVN